LLSWAVPAGLGQLLPRLFYDPNKLRAGGVLFSPDVADPYRVYRMEVICAQREMRHLRQKTPQRREWDCHERAPFHKISVSAHSPLHLS
jgi:hypothetical protein